MFLMKKTSGFVAAIFGVRLQFLFHYLAVLVSRLDKRSDLLSSSILRVRHHEGSY